MSMDKAIEHGKEHRKPWRGSARSKNFDKTCRNHGSCDYCKFNRLHTFMKDDSVAKSKLKEWEEQQMKQTVWYVTYLFLFDNETSMESVETFTFNPTDEDLDDVGEQLAAEFNAKTFIPMRGKYNYKGEWIDCE